jgi:hypothetical protein
MARPKSSRRYKDQDRTENNQRTMLVLRYFRTVMRCALRVMLKNFMLKINFKKILLTAASGIILFVPAVMAEGILPPESGTGKCASPNGCGNYSLNDILLLAVNIANWILGIVGSVALLFFVYGGLVFILSSGNEQKVSEGKQILLNATIGLVIVFTSYIIIQFSMTLLGVTGAGAGVWSDLLKFTKTLR